MKAEVQLGNPFTFTTEEEGRIRRNLRAAARAMELRQDGYRVAVINLITDTNRTIQGALHRAHGVEGAIQALPALPLIPPQLVD